MELREATQCGGRASTGRRDNVVADWHSGLSAAEANDPGQGASCCRCGPPRKAVPTQERGNQESGMASLKTGHYIYWSIGRLRLGRGHGVRGPGCIGVRFAIRFAVFSREVRGARFRRGILLRLKGRRACAGFAARGVPTLARGASNFVARRRRQAREARRILLGAVRRAAAQAVVARAWTSLAEAAAAEQKDW